jgi:hypothetical protein
MSTLMAIFYGESPLYKLELFGSILSAYSMAADNEIEIVIFTDSDLSDFPLPITTYSIKNAQQASKQDGETVHHLVKIYCLVEALDKLARPLIYFDTDIFFNVSPIELFGKISDVDVLMHAKGQKVSDDPKWNKLCDHIESQLEPNDFELNRQSVMYNSGIVGLTPKHKSAMQRSIELTKNLNEVQSLFTLEQFSIGVMLNESSTIHTCEEDVFHYWGWRREFIHIELQRFRDEYSHCTGIELVQAYRDNPIKRGPTIAFVDRLVSRIKSLFNGWDINYRWAYICYLSALREGNNDPEIANTWLKICIPLLIHFEFANEKLVRQSDIKKDFKRLFEPQGGVSQWIDSSFNNQLIKLAG